MNMHDLIVHHLKKSGLFYNSALNFLERKSLFGGTNDVFQIKIPGYPLLVLKIPKPAAREFIDRKNEYQAAMAAAALGVALPFIYFDLDSGVNISVYQEDSQHLTPSFFLEEKIWKKAADIFKKLHHTAAPFQKDFNIFSLITFYQQRMAEKIPENLQNLLDYEDVFKKLKKEFADMDIPSCPCHNDPVLSNFLLMKEKIMLIDWEYAANNDPCWDLASLAVEAELKPQQEKQFLEYYFQENLTTEILRRYQVYKPLSNYLWATWCLAMLDPKKPDKNLLHNAHRRFQLFKKDILTL